jgi:hypothetical protein
MLPTVFSGADVRQQAQSHAHADTVAHGIHHTDQAVNAHRYTLVRYMVL